MNTTVTTQIRKMIEAESFGSGYRLPSERELSQQLGTTRTALRKALSELESEGLIWRHVGKGTFARTNPLTPSVWPPGALFQTNPVEIMEVMAILQPRIAAMASLRAKPREIETMLKYAGRCEQAEETNARLKWDHLMHDTIARSTNNNLLIAISDHLYKSKVWGRRKENAFTPDRWSIYRDQHRRLLESIKDRNPALASEVMSEHIETVRRHLLDIA